VAERFVDLLATEGVRRGLIGPREAPRLWERHLLNCALLSDGIPLDLDVCDIGSGAGLPGLVLALCRPDLALTLVEPLLRRTTFLSEAVDRLALGNVEVVRARAEDLHGHRDFSVVTARAVAPLDRLLAWSMPLVGEGGALLAMKGSSAADEVAAARTVLRRYGAGSPVIEVYGEGVLDPPTTVVRVPAAPPSAPGRPGRRSRKGN
jgi:16S rRNA (guanine527-N7)-methyltransferase